MSLTSEQKKVYTQFKLSSKIVPKHIAVIMDGNGRWAKARKQSRIEGHRQGAEALRATIKACREFGVSYLTAYVFSTENWKRPKAEVNFLMGFFSDLISKEVPEMNKQGVRVRCLGRVDALSPKLSRAMKNMEDVTQHNTKLNLNLMVNYGSRDELVRAIQKINKENLPSSEITETVISSYLDTSGMPDPDILIRTGGDSRISNYLLWQIAYSECFFPDYFWPSFDREKFIEILRDFQQRDRRFGGLN